MATEADLFDLQVLFTRKASGIWVSATSLLGSALALPVPPKQAKALSRVANPADWFRSTVAAGGRDPGRAEQVGALLRDVTFGVEEIGSLLRRTRGAAAAAGRPVVLRLFVAPAVAAALPWELTLDPDDGSRPLALASDIHLARTAQVRTYPLRPEPVSPPLNVLLVLSNPTVDDSTRERTVFDHYEERRRLLGELQPLKDRGLLEVRVEDRPSLDNIQHRIGAEPRGFHVVHYLGHARPNELKLETPEGQPTWVSSALVDELLRRGCPDLRLVVYAGCQTAVTPAVGDDSVRRATSSIADHSVQEACPSVVGMQAVLSAGTERLLTRVFYQALCGGRSIAHALTLARAAVMRDDVVGGQQLEWAVPILVTGDVAGPIFDPAAPAAPLQPLPGRTQLKLDLEEPDREFFSRFRELRTVLDVLTCRRPERIVVITGGSGSGKSRVLARALDELDAEIGYVLYLQAERLARPGRDGSVDPVAALCGYVSELLGRGDPPPLTRDEGWQGTDWWERLAEALVDQTFVLAIEDIDRVPASVAASLMEAIATLVKRRSRCRVALTAMQSEPHLLGRAAAYAVPVGLRPLSEHDVEDWILRNRPALATILRNHPQLLERLFRTKLSSRLELWSAVAGKLADIDLVDVSDVKTAADWALAQWPPPTVSPLTSTEIEESPGVGPGGRTHRGPLRVVVAGPHTAGRTTQFAGAIAQIATAHGVTGRVVTGDGPDQHTSVAILLDPGWPFDAQGRADRDDITKWLQRAGALGPDLILLDYGAPHEHPAESALLVQLAKHGALLVAAGGDSGEPTYPAHLFEVLAVGALDDDGRPRGFSPWFAEQVKPDLYAHDDLSGDPLADVLQTPSMTPGTSFAALRVMAAAVLVWAADRSRTAEEVRASLVESAKPLAEIGRKPGRQPRKLDLDGALAAVRATMVVSALRFGPLEPVALGLASGLDQAVALDVAGTLAERNILESAEDRYQLTSPGDDVPNAGEIARSFAEA